MKVLHVNSENTWRGGELQMANLITNLREMEVGNHIIGRTGSPVIEFAKKESIPYQEVSFKGLKIISALALKKYIIKNEIDIVHAHSANAHSVCVIASVLGSKHKLVVSKRTDFPVKDNFFSKFKYNHPSIVRILCVSNKIAEITKPSIKAAELVKTVYSGINPSRFDVEKKSLKEEFSLDKDTILVGNTSAMAPHKDYFTFLDTAKKLSVDSKYHFVIIGDGPLTPQIQSYVFEKGLSDCVSFTGFRDDVNQILSGLDLFLMTSTEEGLGTSLLDAMYNKVPIVSTRAGGIPEIVIHEETGLTTEPKDVDGLTQLVYEMEKKKKALVKNAFKLVSEEFTDKSTADKTFSEYKEILAEIS